MSGRSSRNRSNSRLSNLALELDEITRNMERTSFSDASIWDKVSPHMKVCPSPQTVGIGFEERNKSSDGELSSVLDTTNSKNDSLWAKEYTDTELIIMQEEKKSKFDLHNFQGCSIDTILCLFPLSSKIRQNEPCFELFGFCQESTPVEMDG